MSFGGGRPGAPAHLGLDPRNGIVTPEGVILDLEIAGVASRLCSGILDALVQALILVVLALLVFSGLTFSGGASTQVSQAVVGILLFAVIFGYPVVYEMLTRGRTLGKIAVGLRVVTIEGAPIRFRHAALRAMGGLVDKWAPPGGVVGTLFVLGTPSRQRIGDLLAGTIVIRDPERTALPSGIWFPIPPGYEAYAATIDPTTLTTEQYTVVRAFLIRSKELTPAARHAVALDLARRSAAAVRHTLPSGVHPETFLLCVLARYQRRTGAASRPAAPSSPVLRGFGTPVR